MKLEANRLQPIIDYKFSDQESQAYRVALIWEDLTRQIFPNEIGISKLPKKGDPRKCSLFKFCWKLMRETRGLLKYEDYRLYVRANLTIVKVKNLHLSPNILCGNSAWIRWKIWKKEYDKRVLAESGKTPDTVEVSLYVMKQIITTKRFLFEVCDGEPNFNKIKTFYDNKQFKLWAGTKVSYLYLILSPWVQKIATLNQLEKEFVFDSKIHQSKIDTNTLIYFKSEFIHEYQ